MFNSTPIFFRPHHFLCTVGFQGRGYSPQFVENFQRIADLLRGQGGDDVVVQITPETDSLCAACPHQDGKKCGSDEAKIRSLDARHKQVLSLEEPQITWGEAKKRIVERVDDDTFDLMCAGCSWKDLGVCLSAIRELRSKLN